MGDQFRISFSRIGNLRSIVPSNVNIMALTATATHETYTKCVEQVGNDRPSSGVHSVDELSGMLNSELREMCEFPKQLCLFLNTRTALICMIC